jgi:hypothetical protein
VAGLPWTVPHAAARMRTSRSGTIRSTGVTGRGSQSAGDALRLGVLYADGRRTATPAGHWQPDDKADPGRLMLQHGGGGGDARRWDGRFWLYPLPPEGPVTFVASWHEYGVAETRAELDGSAIREAAGHAVILSPEEPEPE